MRLYQALIMINILLITTLFAMSASSVWDDPIVSDDIVRAVCFDPITYPSIVEQKIHECLCDHCVYIVDLVKENNPRLKSLALFDKKYKQEHKEFSLVRKGLYFKLLNMLKYLPDNIGIAYYECCRPLYIQKKYFDKKYREILKQIPDKQKAYEETAKLVAPFISFIPPHSTGGAIDMTLFIIDEDGTESLLDMGKFGVIFGLNDQQETFSDNTTLRQRLNRLLLLNVAAKAGLKNYAFEWWHFSYGDQMWAHMAEEPAIYNAMANYKTKEGIDIFDFHLQLLTKKMYIETFDTSF